MVQRERNMDGGGVMEAAFHLMSGTGGPLLSVLAAALDQKALLVILLLDPDLDISVYCEAIFGITPAPRKEGCELGRSAPEIYPQ